MGAAWVLKMGIAIGLVGAVLYGVWYAKEQGMFRPAMTTKIYNQPLFLLHVQAISTQGRDGRWSNWITDMYFAGHWTAGPSQPGANNQVLLKWGNVIPMLCLIDQRPEGPFVSNIDLCPTVRRVGAKFSEKELKELGCTS